MSEFSEGYEVVEVEELDDLIQIHHRAIAVAILNWLAAELTRRLVIERDQILIEVIKVTYLGSYPSLGVRYSRALSESAARNISDKLRRLASVIVTSTPVASLVAFVASHRESWDVTARVLMEESP